MTDLISTEQINLVFTPISFENGMAGSQRLKNLVKLLSAKNIYCKNIVLTNTSYKEQDFYYSNSVVNISYQKEIFSILTLPVKVFKYLKQFKINGKNILYNYGYIHVQNLYVILFAKLLGYKIIVDIVEDNFTIEQYKSIWSKFRIKSSLFFLKRMSFIVNGAIVINEHLYGLVHKFIKNKIPFIVIPISIDPAEFKIESNPNNYDIFYGGSFGKKDGLIFLLKAFDIIAEKYPQSRLIVSGKGNAGDMLSLNESINKLKNKERLIFHGYLSREAYIELLQSCTVHCMTRINSNFANAGFPFKLGEMMATGKPVIATKIGEIENFLVDGLNSILITPGSVEEIVNSLNFVFNNRKDAELIGENGRKTALKLFNLEAFCPQILNFIKYI